MGRIRGDSQNTVEANIDLGVIGSRDTQKELAQTNDLVARIGKEVEAFDKKGGLGRMAAGSERILATEANLAAMALQLDSAQLKARELRLELSKVPEGSARFRQVRQEVADTEASIRNLELQIAKLPVELRESGRAAVGAFGDIDTSLQTFAGTLQNLTAGQGTIGRQLASVGIGGEAGVLGKGVRGLQLAGDLAATAEQIPLFSASLGTLRQRFTEGIAAQGGYLNALKAGTAAIAPFVAAMGAFILVQKAGEAASKAARGPLDDFFGDLDERSKDALASFEGLSSVDIRESIDQQKAYHEALEQNASDLRFVNEGWKDTNQAIQTTAGALDRIGVFKNPIDEVRTKLEETEAEIKSSTAELERLEEALEAARIAEAERRNFIAQETNTAFVLTSINRRIELEKQLSDLQEQSAEQVREQIASWRDEATLTSEAIIGEFATFQRDLEQRSPEVAAQLQDILDYYEDVLHIPPPDLSTVEGIRTYINEIQTAAKELGLELTPAQQQVIDGLFEMISSLNRLEQSADRVESQILPLTAAMDAQAAAAEQAAQNQERLQQATEALGTAQTEYADFLSQRAIEETRQAQRAGVEADLQNRISAAKDREAALARRQQLVKLQHETTTREKDALKKSHDETIKLTDKFRRDNERDLLAHNRRLQDIEEDKRDSLFQAQLDNDVTAFDQAERQADQQKNREQRNFDDQSREREAQHSLELQERRQQAQQEVQQIRDQGRERITAERETGKVILTESQRLERELQATRDRFRQEDAQRQRAAQESVHTNRIAQLQAELVGIKLLHSGANELARGISQLVSNAARSASLGSLGRISAGSRSAGGAAGRFSFGDGGIINQLIEARMGEKAPYEKELLLPFKPSEGLETAVKRAGIAPPPIVMNMNAPVTITGVDTSNMAALESRLTQHVQQIATITVQTVQRVMEHER